MSIKFDINGSTRNNIGNIMFDVNGSTRVNIGKVLYDINGSTRVTVWEKTKRVDIIKNGICLFGFTYYTASGVTYDTNIDWQGVKTVKFTNPNSTIYPFYNRGTVMPVIPSAGEWCVKGKMAYYSASGNTDFSTGFISYTSLSNYQFFTYSYANDHLITFMDIEPATINGYKTFAKDETVSVGISVNRGTIYIKELYLEKK